MITELFIKQCEQAEEIQKTWKPTIGDYSFNDGIFIISKIQSDMTTKMYRLDDINNFLSVFEMENILQDNFIWLPTQERLQEMLHNYYQNNNSNAKGLEWGDSINEYMLNQLLNFEKDNREIVYNLNSLWLAFVMHELYNKVWTGEKWEGR